MDIERVTVNNKNDILKVLSEFAPESSALPDVKLTSKINTFTDNKPVIMSVSANTVTKSRRQILLDGFQVLRSRRELVARCSADVRSININGRDVVPIPPVREDTRLAIDSLINRWFGGHRDGEYICWNLPEGTFRYDIVAHRLFQSDASDKSTTS